MKKRLLLSSALSLCVCVCAFAQGSDSALAELMGLIKENAVGGKEYNLEQVAIDGLLSKLKPVVQLQGAVANDVNYDLEVPTEAKVIDKTFEDKYLSLRIEGLMSGCDKLIRERWNKADKEKIAGIILDLRNTYSLDYDAVAEIASLFRADGESNTAFFMLGEKSYSRKCDCIAELAKLPLIVLVNSNTAAAGEALGATLCQNASPTDNRVTISIGNTTAGKAITQKEFELSNGQKILIAVNTIHFPNQSFIPADGYHPNIYVQVPEDAEKIYLEDPFRDLRPKLESKDLTKGTNKVSIRINEAELVKMQKDSKNFAEKTETKHDEIEYPTIQDPVLARAVDLFKALAFMENVKK